MRVGFSLAAWLLSLACLPAVVFAAAPCERLMATADRQSPPYLWADPEHSGKLIGANIDLIQLLGNELKVPIKLLDSGSWFAAQQDVQSGRIDLLFGAFSDAPDQQQFDYLQPATWPDSASGIEQRPALFLALGQNSACNTPLLRGQLSKKLAKLRASGQLDTLLQTNLRLWQAQQLPVLPVLDAPNR